MAVKTFGVRITFDLQAHSSAFSRDLLGMRKK